LGDRVFLIKLVLQLRKVKILDYCQRGVRIVKQIWDVLLMCVEAFEGFSVRDQCTLWPSRCYPRRFRNWE